MTQIIVVPHLDTVRTYSFITSNNNTLFGKKREKQFKTFNTMEEFRKSKVCPMFNIVKNEEGKYVIAVGQYIASNKKFDTPDQVERYIGTKPWELIVNVMQITMYYNENNKKTAKKSAKASKETAKNAETN